MADRAASVLYSLYKRTLSPMLHSLTGTSGACRFQPTCSEYAAISVSTYGWFRGGWYALTRVLRCNPLSQGGFDPVPGTWTPPPQSAPESTDSCRVGPRHLP